MAAPQFKLTIPIPHDFVDELKEIMDNEFEIASKKWQVYPNAAQRNHILTSSVDQLKLRINKIVASSWSLESDRVTLSMPGPKGEMEWGTPESEASDFKFIRARDGWIIDQDKDIDSVAMADLPEAVLSEFKRWAATAIFYGVGSYKS